MIDAVMIAAGLVEIDGEISDVARARLIAEGEQWIRAGSPPWDWWRSLSPVTRECFAVAGDRVAAARSSGLQLGPPEGAPGIDPDGAEADAIVGDLLAVAAARYGAGQ